MKRALSDFSHFPAFQRAGPLPAPLWAGLGVALRHCRGMLLYCCVQHVLQHSGTVGTEALSTLHYGTVAEAP